MITAETPKSNLEDKVEESQSTKPKIPCEGNHEGKCKRCRDPEKVFQKEKREETEGRRYLF